MSSLGGPELKKKKKKKSKLSIFFQLLRFLSIYDILVGLSGCLTYGLPPLWETYSYEVLPRIAPWLLPLIHAALMTSVYCTVILSLERYVRICYLCQLRDWSYPYVTEKNVHFYKLGLVLLPILFYMPKFFEVRWVYHKVGQSLWTAVRRQLNRHCAILPPSQ